MTTLKQITKWILALTFVFVGILHFVNSDVFVGIIPDYLPWHLPLVLISGGFEIVLGVCLLIPKTTRIAAWGMIALMIAVFPANIELFLHQDRFPIELPYVLHLLRLPMQALLIAWAWWYTRDG